MHGCSLIQKYDIENVSLFFCNDIYEPTIFLTRKTEIRWWTSLVLTSLALLCFPFKSVSQLDTKSLWIYFNTFNNRQITLFSTFPFVFPLLLRFLFPIYFQFTFQFEIISLFPLCQTDHWLWGQKIYTNIYFNLEYTFGKIHSLTHSNQMDNSSNFFFFYISILHNEWTIRKKAYNWNLFFFLALCEMVNEYVLYTMAMNWISTGAIFSTTDTGWKFHFQFGVRPLCSMHEKYR